MSEESKPMGGEQVEATAGETQSQAGPTVTEEIKVQAQDLFKLLNDVIREGTAKRFTVMRNDRILVDIPLALGIAASVIFAIYTPVLAAIVGVGALLGGCTVRIERDEPKDET